MNKELKFLTIIPDDSYFTWQVHLWLESLKEIGQSDKAIVLLYIPQNRQQNPKWQQVIDLYPEAEFHFYKDENGELNPYLGIYIPILRPWTAWNHFKKHPELSEKAIFYCDSDILFMKDFNVDKFLEDDVCYMSDTNSYINARYFESKERDVLPNKLEEYKTRDILAETMSLVGVDKQIAIDNNDHSGGTQYLLKNIDAAFWSKVMNDCILIRTYLQKVNREFFESENKGYQSWCSDMFSVLWTIWFRNQKGLVVPELNFAWSTDPIQRLETHTILHNAGIVGTMQETWPAFYKGKYHGGGDPTNDVHLNTVLTNEETKKHCNWYYADKLRQLKLKYNLNY